MFGLYGDEAPSEPWSLSLRLHAVKVCVPAIILKAKNV